MIKLILKDSFHTRVLISETGKNLNEFASLIGVSHSYLSQILSAKRNPSVGIANKIAKGLDVKIDEIFLITNVANDNREEVKAH